MSRWDPLFGRRPLAHVLASRLEEARSSISKLPLDSLTPEKVASIAARARPAPLALRDQNLEVVDSSPTPRLRLEIAVEGDPELWWTTPSRSSPVVPDAEVAGNTLVFDQPLEPDHDAKAIKRWRDENVERLERWVAWVNADLADFENRLGQELERAVADRRDVLDRLDQLRRELT